MVGGQVYHLVVLSGTVGLGWPLFVVVFVVLVFSVVSLADVCCLLMRLYSNG